MTVKQIEGNLLEMSHELNGILLNYVNHELFIMKSEDYINLQRISKKIISLIDLIDYKKIYE